MPDAEPYNLEAEQAVIGSILLNAEAFEKVKDRLNKGKFYEKAHRTIYKAMCDVYDSKAAIDIVTVSAALQDDEKLEAIGNVSYLARLTNSVPTASNISYYADIVLDMSLRRESLLIARELVKHATSEQDVAGFVALAEKRISKLTAENKPPKAFVTMKDALFQVFDQTEERFNNRHINEGITGMPSGLTDLDKMTAGFQKSDLIIIAARPSVGKTAFALNIAQNVGIRAKETVAIFSLEMSATQLVQRMISAEGNIDGEKLKTGYFEPDDWGKMTNAIGILSDANIFIDDTPGITVGEIRYKCRELKKEKGLGMILIDYLQLIRGNGRSGENRQQEVSEISRTLKEIARELEVPVIALSQLSRGVEQRQDKRPMMSDLRESGSIEQDADIVGFLYRDDYYDKQTEKKNIIEVIISKQRNGKTGTVELAFRRNYGKMVNLDRQTTVDDHEQMV
ncbi:replicative DNA helicase [Paenibacillus sp. FSL H8-0548]|uniref:replicative DNA helicase n=1 Tax=Paenibacillus sp. FSL H8-0548 TaxID=1920422 RepID=UPI00096F69CF|nr:replicative DNA helicase [Paenibacillus sp. FSL H8-0548]OMF35318.1 replicative DNA helicase [Paenibacillus sp. FSL H8-0548]